MHRISSIAISILFLIGVAGFAFTYKPNVPAAPVAVAPTTETYTDSVHGYSFTYPAELDVLAYTDDQVAIGHLIEGGIEGIADVRVIDVEGRAGETLTSAVARELATLCAADGPTASISCDGIARTEPITAASGAQGTLLYLQAQTRAIPSGDITETEKGPYYVFPIRSSAAGSRVVVVHAPLNLMSVDENAAIIREIALSVAFTAPSE